MSKFLDNIGVGILWNKIKEKLKLKVDKKDIEPIIIEEISFYELLKYTEDKENYNGTEINSELINAIYNKVKQAVDENRCLLMSYAPTNVDIINSYFELDKVIVDNEASLGIIINNFVYSIYINIENNTIIVKKLNNTNINITELKEEIKNKVDKVEGKQLTTEDFTTALKERLESLENYDDTELSNKIEELKNNLDTILDSNNVTTVIDTWQEIEAFLAGITNQETLTGLLADLKSDIMALCANTYLPLNGGEISTNGVNPFNINNSDTNENAYLYQNFRLNGVNKARVGYSKTLGAYINNPTASKYLGIRDDGTPYFDNYKLFHEDNDGPGSGLDADTLDGKHSSEFMISVNGWSGDLNTMVTCGAYRLHNNNPNVPSNDYYYGQLLVIHGAADTIAQMCFSNSKSKAAIRCGNPSDVGGFGDWTPWKEIAFTDSNVASADKLTTKQLTNEDLNTIKDINFSSYSAGGGNSVTNTPDGYKGIFYLQVFGLTNDYICQILTIVHGSSYKRIYSDSKWSSWKRLLTEDDLPKTWIGTEAEYNALTKDANTIYYIKE